MTVDMRNLEAHLHAQASALSARVYEAIAYLKRIVAVATPIADALRLPDGHLAIDVCPALPPRDFTYRLRVGERWHDLPDMREATDADMSATLRSLLEGGGR